MANKIIQLKDGSDNLYPQTYPDVATIGNQSLRLMTDNATQAQWRNESGSQLWFTYNKTTKTLYANLVVNGVFVGSNQIIAQF